MPVASISTMQLPTGRDHGIAVAQRAHIMSVPRRWVLSALFLPGLTGCAGTVAQMAREATPAAIVGGLQAADDPVNRAHLAEVMRAPEVRAAIRSLSEDLADGALDTLTSEQRQARIQALTQRYLTLVLHALAAGIRDELGPAMADATRQAVGAALRESLRTEYQQAIQQVIASAAATATTAAGHAMADSLRSDLGPALHDTILRDITPALTASLNDGTNRALAVTARAVSREAVLGGNDALVTIQRAANNGTARPSLLTRFSNITDKGVRLINVVAVLSISAVLALILWILRLTARSRRLQAESERRAATAVMVTEALKATEGKPWSDELRQFLRERFGKDPAASDLQALLRPPRDSEVSDGESA